MIYSLMERAEFEAEPGLKPPDLTELFYCPAKLLSLKDGTFPVYQDISNDPLASHFLPVLPAIFRFASMDAWVKLTRK